MNLVKFNTQQHNQSFQFRHSFLHKKTLLLIVILFTYKYYHTSQTNILSSSTWANTLLRMRNGKALTTVFSSPTYFLPPLIEIHIGLAKLKGFVSFYFCIKFDHHSYDCFFLVIFFINFIFNFILQHLVSFNFYIKFIPHCFYCYFLVLDPFLN